MNTDGQLLQRRAYLNEALGYATAGIKPRKEEGTIELPEELTAALEADRGLAEAFSALTPGKQRSHVIALNSAKKSDTRMARIAALRGRILAGKGATERRSGGGLRTSATAGSTGRRPAALRSTDVVAVDP